MIERQTNVLREFLALTIFFMAIFMALSLISYAPSDPGLNHQTSGGHIVNNAGLVGAYAAGILVDFFGLGALAFPFACLFWSGSLIFPQIRPRWWRSCGAILSYIVLLVWFSYPWALEHVRIFRIQGGGFCGTLIQNLSLKYLKYDGSLLVLTFLTLVAVQLTAGFSWTSLCKRARSKGLDIWYKHLERAARRQKLAVQKRQEPSTANDDPSPATPKVTPRKNPSKKTTVSVTDEPGEPATPRKVRVPITASNAALPGLELLSPVPDSQPKIPQAQLDDLSRRLKACLADFGIQGEVMRVQPGPVITMLEFKPAPGIKISRISGLGDDLSLALKAMAVRIVAPLPGKDTVGIEIPNAERQMVYLQEILSSPVYTKSKARIPLALGKDIQGQPRLADLAAMPHLLVAGATGAGKSVCLNTIILSILYKSSPEEVKLLMIDPKRIELAVYSRLPHLVHPVVTEMTLAKSALDWVVYEMEQRYEALAKLGVRNIESYNQKLAAMGKVRPEELQDLAPYPYLVIIVDELADLMLTAGKEVEVSIIRLAQLARAAGIHLILATQRPSVDVVTGLIKANFPARIAFQVSSQHDSRTILDSVGAEYLLGKGDMLFKKSGGNLTRIHGAFV
ncbi:MAG: DNA translocase FtsK 4TM domain-containing protein, partial [Desulfoplanes sp.]